VFRNSSRSLTLRVSLILAGAILLVVLAIGGALVYQQKQSSSALIRLPLPEQAAAIAEVVEDTPPERLPQLLKALNSPGLEVTVSDRLPDLPQGGVKLPGLSWIVKRYVEKLGDRVIQVSAGERQVAAGGQGAERPLQLVIGLHQGRYLTIQAREGVLRYLLWMRLVSGSILALSVIGGGSLWLLRRQIRPLEEMAHAVERFV
jgi:hypothetical protein